MFEMLGTAVFAISGVLAVTRRGLDVFGALVLGLVTALGGGTVRDLIIGAPVSATSRVLMLGLPGPVAVVMGLLTGIGGGLLRDVLAGRPTGWLTQRTD